MSLIIVLFAVFRKNKGEFMNEKQRMKKNVWDGTNEKEPMRTNE